MPAKGQIIAVDPWPPPARVRPILLRARASYHALEPTRRPALRGRSPDSYVVLFPPCDLVALAQAGYWPLGGRALAWLAEPPGHRAPRTRRQRLIAAVVRDVLAAELPEAVAYLLRRKP